MTYENNETKIIKQNIEPKKKLNKQIKAKNFREIKQDLEHHSKN